LAVRIHHFEGQGKFGTGAQLVAGESRFRESVLNSAFEKSGYRTDIK
jgi:hypothetical protein